MRVFESGYNVMLSESNKKKKVHWLISQIHKQDVVTVSQTDPVKPSFVHNTRGLCTTAVSKEHIPKPLEERKQKQNFNSSRHWRSKNRVFNSVTSDTQVIYFTAVHTSDSKH